MRRALFAIALLLAACATPRTADEARPQLVDLTDDFAREWTRTKGMADAERVFEFKKTFATALPGFHSHERFDLVTAERYDEHLLAALKSYPQEEAGIRETSARFADILVPAQRSFEAEFGPMTGYPPVFLVNSLGEFDGSTRSLPEGVRLLFGADMIYRLHRDGRIQPFFHHELFHLYHVRNFPECDPIWCTLWIEGLATYVASRLNPETTDAELLLVWPEPLRPAVERDRRHAICTVTAKLDSTAAADHKALFSNGRVDERLPSRFGYYVGYLIASELGKTRSLQTLARLNKDEALPLVKEALRSLAACPA